MRLDLTTLRLFEAVAKYSNIAHAAEAEHLAPSAISKRISDLEASLDVQLLVRSRNGVTMTAAGAALLIHIRSLNDVADRLRSEISIFASGARGLVRLAANPSSITQFLPPILTSFHASNPNVRIELLEEVSSRTVQLVSDRAADIGIVAGSVDFGGLQTMDFRRDNLAMMMHRSHPLAGRKSVAFAETLGYSQVGLAEGSSIQATLFDAARTQGQRLDLIVRVASFDALRILVAEKIGIACLPIGCIKPYLKTHDLTYVRLRDSWASRELKICVRKEKQPRALARFLQELQK